MDSNQLNRWLSISANLGVLAGLIFLAFELRQNNQFLAEESRYGQVQARVEFNRDIVLNPEYASAYYNTTDAQKLDRYRRLAAKRRAMLMWQWEFESIWWETQESSETITRHWKSIFSEFGYEEFWREEKSYFSPSFVNYIDENVAN